MKLKLSVNCSRFFVNCSRFFVNCSRFFVNCSRFFIPIDKTGSLNVEISGTEVIKLFFLLKSAEHKILNAHKYTNNKKFSFLLAQISL